MYWTAFDMHSLVQVCCACGRKKDTNSVQKLTVGSPAKCICLFTVVLIQVYPLTTVWSSKSAEYGWPRQCSSYCE